MNVITEIVLKALQCNYIAAKTNTKDFVNLRIQASQTSCKTSILNQFRGNTGIYWLTNYSTASNIRGLAPQLKEKRYHTMILEDITWIKGAKIPSVVLDSVKGYIDGYVGVNQFDTIPPIEYACGIIITCTDDLFTRVSIKNAYESATLESRIVDIWYEIDNITKDKIIDSMQKRINSNKPKFRYPMLDIEQTELIDKPIELDNKLMKSVTNITRNPKIAEQIMLLLRQGLNPEHLKYFELPKKTVSLEGEIDCDKYE